MGILPRLFNKTVNITKLDNTVSKSGDVGESVTTVYNNVKCRITNNKMYGSDALDVAGYIAASSHIMFCDPLYPNITKGCYIFDSSKNKKYLVMFVDDEPGGVTDHHYEIYLRYSEALDEELS